MIRQPWTWIGDELRLIAARMQLRAERHDHMETRLELAATRRKLRVSEQTRKALELRLYQAQLAIELREQEGWK